MIRTRNKLTVLHDANSVFTDHSSKAVDYGRDTFNITLASATDYLYVGFYKPINSTYIETSSPSGTDTTLTAEYYSGSWSSLDAHDETRAFQRSGFISWDRNLESEAVVTINGTEQYWYRFKPALDTTAITFDGINIVFSDDEDLKREFYEADKWLPATENSHILTHVAARDEIVQQIRNDGVKKKNGLQYRDITAFDLLDIPQVKLASTYLVLSKIFGVITDDPDDSYRQKSLYYRNLFNGAMNIYFLDIDKDDDGQTDDSERMGLNTGGIVRR